MPNPTGLSLTVLALALAMLATAPGAAALLDVAVRVEAPGLLPDLGVGASTKEGLIPEVRVDVNGAPLVEVGAPQEARAKTQAHEAPAPTPRALDAEAAVVAVGATALLQLAAFAIVPLYSRISKGTVLQNPVRGQVFQFIQDNPGATVTDLTRALDIGWGTAVHHVDQLTKTGYLTAVEGRGARHLFAAGAHTREERLHRAAARGTAGRILDYVGTNPGTPQAAIAEALGLGAPAVSKHLARLVSAGLVRAEREWRTVRYFPATPGQEARPAPTAAPGLAAG